MSIFVVQKSGDQRQGSYLLRVQVEGHRQLAFGRFNQGNPIVLPSGIYGYVGSAMGNRGAPLARRLLRHATRTGSRSAHTLYAELARALNQAGLVGGEVPPSQAKRLHWHIDYLLDQPWAHLVGAIAVVSAQRLEAQLAGRLAADPWTEIVAPGLGASDAPGGTHLFRLPDSDGWWLDLAIEWRADW